ncbi:MAG TPA: ring-cleaving dioxygenase [Tepidisphaeraceae bacterium]|jgi:glyoxalase family protein
MQLAGIHHLTAITADAKANKSFYTETLGMRLVKKTVNQDDVSAYHLFYADGAATPGSDVTFFDWPSRPARRGTSGIVRTGLRVAAESLPYWRDRLESLNITHGPIIDRDGRQTLEFEDPEGQRLSLVEDDNRLPVHPWEKSPVPARHQIRGLGPITISVTEIAATEAVLTELMNMRKTRTFTTAVSSDGSAAPSTVHVFSMGEGGPAAELHVAVEPHLNRGIAGAGGVHHVAFRVPTFEEYDSWAARLEQLGVKSSGPVDRYYFRSLYFREPGGTLFELATDGPGFATDEPMETLGEKLALPPFLEPHRASIEAGLKPLH